MEDSSLFMQWAMSTLQQEYPPATPAAAATNDDSGDAVASLPVLVASWNSVVPGEPPAREGHRATNNWSSGDTDSSGGGGSSSITAVERDGGWSPSQNSARCAAPPSSGGSSTNQPMSWDFNSASARPSNDAMQNAAAAAAVNGGGVAQMVQGSPPTRRTSAKNPELASSASFVQDHIMAERKRREKINKRFIELSSVIPGLKKMDKATILSDAVRHVKELKEKLRSLEDGANRGRSTESAVLTKKPCIAPTGEEDGRPPPHVPAAPVVSKNALPEITAKISEESDVMVRIHCEDAKGVLVKVLAEVEGLHLSITHTSVTPFTGCTLIMTITAKVEPGFKTTVEDVVGRLNSTLL